MEPAMRSADAASTCNPSSVVLEPDQRVFSGNTNGLKITASIRFISNTSLKGNDDTCGKTTVEADDLRVSE